jgi:hypothetical protein
MAYTLEGRMLEVCTCKAICPCWVGEDPDNGKCDGTMAWHFEKGSIDGVDVAGLTIGMLAHIPGNVLKGNFRAIVFVDDRATPEQEKALLSVYTGKQGGPVADLAALIGEVVAVERVPIKFDVHKGKGHYSLGNTVEVDLEPFLSANGHPTTLVDAVFSNIPGSPAYVGKAAMYKADAPKLGMKINLTGHNSVQGAFRFVS